MRLGFALLLAVLGALAWQPSHADALAVSPTTLTLPRQGGMAVLYVVNRGTIPVMAQVEGFTWTQSVGRDRLDAAPRMQLSPPLMRLQPGTRQVVRIAVPALSGVPREHAYRLIVSELPDARRHAEQGLHVLLRFSVPVFVGTPRGARPNLSWSLRRHGERLWLRARNDGGTRAKLIGLGIREPGGRQAKVSDHALHYVLAGQACAWPLDNVAFAPGQRVRVTGQYADSERAVKVDLSVPSAGP